MPAAFLRNKRVSEREIFLPLPLCLIFRNILIHAENFLLANLFHSNNGKKERKKKFIDDRLFEMQGLKKGLKR